MFERFTERARQVVVLAQDEARALKHNYIGTEHILLGLLREEEGLAARVLESLDITVEEVRAQVARIVGQGDEVTTGQIPFTPRAMKVLELALREALSLGHNYIGTEHILLGLVRENGGVAAWILFDGGATPRRVAGELVHRARIVGRDEYVASFAAGSPNPAIGEEAHEVVSRGARRDRAGRLFEAPKEVWTREARVPLGWTREARVPLGFAGLLGVAIGLLAGWLIWS